jgi:hypothetical protein
MSCSYVVDDSARRIDKTAFPTAEQAIECAAESARKLNRAISIWEIDSERKSEEYPKGPMATKHYAMVFPDGSHKKTKGDKTPYEQHMEEATSGEDPKKDAPQSLEEALKLPTLTLGSMVAQLDQAALLVEDAALRAKILKTSDALANSMERPAKKEATVEKNPQEKLSASLIKAKHFKNKSGKKLDIVGVDNAGAITATVNGTDIKYSPRDLAKFILQAGFKAVAADDGGFCAPVGGGGEKSEEKPAEGSEEEKPAVAHHLNPGDVAVVDDVDRAYVLDTAEGVYVVLMNNAISQVPDDVTRIRVLEDAGTGDAKAVKRIFRAFFKNLLKLMAVDNVTDLNADQKAKFFDAARRKWPKVEQKMLEENGGSSTPDIPEPVEVASRYSSLLAYTMELCGKNLDAADALARAVQHAKSRDATKMNALEAMRKYSHYQLPEGWCAVAKVLADRRASEAAFKMKVNITPPTLVVAIAKQALESGGLTGVTLDHATTVATGKPMDLNSLERARMFFENNSPVTVPANVWAAWGGTVGAEWVENLSSRMLVAEVNAELRTLARRVVECVGMLESSDRKGGYSVAASTKDILQADVYTVKAETGPEQARSVLKKAYQSAKKAFDDIERSGVDLQQYISVDMLKEVDQLKEWLATRNKELAKL